MSDQFCHRCGDLKQKYSGYYLTVGISEYELDHYSKDVKDLIDLKLEQARRQLIHKLGLDDDSHDLSRSIP